MSVRILRVPDGARDAFLEALAEGSSVTSAARTAGVGRSTAYEWRAGDEDFAARWAAALEEGTDRLEDEAVRRAMSPEDPDAARLLMFLLKGRRRETYGDQLKYEGRIEVDNSQQRQLMQRAADQDPEAFERIARAMREAQDGEPPAAA